MTDRPDLPRWRLRLGEFERMLDLFARTDALRRERPLSEAEEAGLVQFFELSVELAWKTLAARLRHDGTTLPHLTPVSVFREAARTGWVDDPDLWIEAVERRNAMSHTYDLAVFRTLVADAGETFLPAMMRLRDSLAEA